MHAHTDKQADTGMHMQSIPCYTYTNTVSNIYSKYATVTYEDNFTWIN